MFNRFIDRAAASRWGIPLTALLYLALASGVALVQRPNDEEGFHANIGYTLIEHGRLAAPIWDPAGLPRFTNIDKVFYGHPPAIFLLLAGWFKLFGVGLFQLRFFSVFFGLVGLVAWAAFFRKIGMDRRAVFLSALLIAADFIYTRFSAGRPFDVALTCLLALALWSYLRLRERSLGLAIFVSQSCAALAGMIHANGLLIWTELAALTLLMDWKNLKWKYLFPAAAPYLVGGAGVAWYILQDIPTFKVQFFELVDFSGKKGIWGNIWGTIRSEFFLAYGFTTSIPPAARILSFILFLYWGSMAYLVRLRSQLAARRILGLCAIHLFFFTFVFTHKWPIYVMFFIPLFAAAAALTWTDLGERGRSQAWFSGALLAAILMSLAANAYRFRNNEYWSKYRPDMQEARRLIRPEDTLFGNAETAFDLGMERVLHDSTLGYYNGQDRSVILVDTFYPELWKWYQRTRPEVYAFVARKLDTEYELVYSGHIYKVYRKKTAS